MPFMFLVGWEVINYQYCLSVIRHLSTDSKLVVIVTGYHAYNHKTPAVNPRSLERFYVLQGPQPRVCFITWSEEQINAAIIWADFCLTASHPTPLEYSVASRPCKSHVQAVYNYSRINDNIILFKVIAFRILANFHKTSDLLRWPSRSYLDPGSSNTYHQFCPLNEF